MAAVAVAVAVVVAAAVAAVATPPPREGSAPSSPFIHASDRKWSESGEGQQHPSSIGAARVGRARVVIEDVSSETNTLWQVRAISLTPYPTPRRRLPFLNFQFRKQSVPSPVHDFQSSTCHGFMARGPDPASLVNHTSYVHIVTRTAWGLIDGSSA